MTTLQEISIALWQSFYDFVKSLQIPTASDALITSCESVLSLLRTAQEPLNQYFLAVTTPKVEFTVGKTRGFTFTYMAQIFGIILGIPAFRGSIDFYQLIAGEDANLPMINERFLQEVWLTTKYQEVIIYYYEGKLPLPFREHFEGEGHRQEGTSISPLRLTFVKLLPKETSRLGSAYILQDRLESHPNDHFLLVQESSTLKDTQERDQMYPIYGVYEFLIRFYNVTGYAFPKTAQNFLFYLFYGAFGTTESLWNSLLEKKLDQCNTGVTAYS
jgi:hypothetical protein